MTESFVFPALPGDLPPGRLIRATVRDSLDDEREVLWVSDHPQSRADQLWGRLYGRRAATGLYPLLLDTLESVAETDPEIGPRPWHSAELDFVPVDAINALDPAEVLREMWPAAVGDDEFPYPGVPHEWPGPAARGVSDVDPDSAAAELAYRLAADSARLIGLVPAESGADALALCGWEGPLNHTNFTEEIAVVVRSWERRFGVRVVMVGFDTLHLSVAAPPETPEHAQQVAAEHLSFCPDNVDHDSFDAYAKSLIGSDTWYFWWD
ncbi:DUF4253 domain-containing protein [Nocardia sp. NBC_00416]|uniref:DUF4253 domain-containing protein n=1 Tax=Nocardia sp. NBC_00416 TaxID=2975991 RepID=UPI002E225DAA